MAVTPAIVPFSGHKPVTPVSGSCPWFTVIAAHATTGLRLQDAAAITDPNAEITDATRVKIEREHYGTLLRLRMGYDDGLTGITSPVVRVFGRTGDTDPWQILPNKAGSTSVTITAAPATDVSDGTLNYTTPDPTTHTWDCDGCNEILVGVQTVLEATGDMDTALLQGKFI